MKLQLKRSNVLELGAAKEPTSAQMEYGELAVNYNDGDPALFIKDSADNIIRIAGTGSIGSGDTPSGPIPPSTGNEIGDIFFDTTLNGLVYWDGTSWVELSDDENAAKIYVGTLAEIDNDVIVNTRRNGFLWWNTEDGTLYVWYEDGNTEQWVVAVPAAAGNDDGGASVTISDTAPSTGDSDPGDLWWNTVDRSLYIYYEDTSGASWVLASPVSEAPYDNKQYARQNGAWQEVVSSGGGGAATEANIYGTAKAWGNIGADGTEAGTFNASVNKTGLGSYTVTFINPLPTANYSVVLGSGQSNIEALNSGNKTANGFTVVTYANLGNGTLIDGNFNFAVHDEEPAEIIIGSGTVANTNIYGTAKVWLNYDGITDTIRSSHNVSSVTKLGTGDYEVSFDTPFADTNYVPLVMNIVRSDSTSGSTAPGVRSAGGYSNPFSSLTTSSVRIQHRPSGVNSDTNLIAIAIFDNTPAEVALTTFGDVINYSGAAAWGNVSSTGSLDNGLNCTTAVSPDGFGVNVTFNSPMPNNKYAITATAGDRTNTSSAVSYKNVTPNGFLVYVRNGTGTAALCAFSFAVHALNALPPKGGTGTDAWALVASDASILSSFNIATVTKISDGGRYQYTFTTPMPNANYAVQATSNSTTQPRASAYVYNKDANGFQVQVFVGTAGQNAAHAVSVNATNAQLPDTVTQEQIESALNNPGLSAWGDVDEFGPLLNGINCTTSYSGGGIYVVTFTTPMPSDEYSVNLTGFTGQECYISSQSATGFSVVQRVTTTGAAASGRFGFQVAATNALPPKGGTGTDSWGAVQSDGTLDSSFNVDSVTRISEGYYQVVFTTAMPTSGYGVVTSTEIPTPVDTAAVYTTITVTQKTAAGFYVTARFENRDDGSARDIDAGFNFAVNATNAKLPNSFSEEEIQSIVDFAQSGVTNPGASAWGYIDANGTIEGGLNVASVTETSSGNYQVTFLTPMPNSNYAVNATGNGASYYDCFVYSKSASGFELGTRDASGNAGPSKFSFTVFATNALPPKGGTGTDAWGSCANDGALNASFNVASVTRTATGEYDVVLTSPMPTADYSVIATAQSVTRKAAVGSKTVNGFTCYTSENGSSTPQNTSFDFSVNATNATLPTTFTEAQIQSVIDLAQSLNPSQLAKAWGSVNDGGTQADSYNIASVTNSGTGVYEVTFTTPMPSAFYSVSTAVTSNTYAVARPTNKTANGFTMRTLYSSSGTPTPGAYAFDFQVFANG